MYFIRKNKTSNFAKSKLDSKTYNEALFRAARDCDYDSTMNAMRTMDPVLSLPAQLSIAAHDIGRYSLLKKMAMSPLMIPVDLLTGPVSVPYTLYRFNDLKDPKYIPVQEKNKGINKEIEKIFKAGNKSNSMLPEGSKLTKGQMNYMLNRIDEHYKDLSN